MANVQHSAITDPDVHEPKGIVGVAAGKVYVSNGSGSGAWNFPYPPGIASATAGQIFTADGAGGGTWSSPATLKNFGEMYIQGNAAATTIATVHVPVKVTAGLTAGTLSGLTFSADKLVTPDSAKYRIDVALSFFGVAATTIDWEFDIYINSTAMGRKQRIQTTGAEHRTVALSGITGTLAVNDQISVYVTNKTDTSSPTIVDLSCLVQEL